MRFLTVAPLLVFQQPVMIMRRLMMEKLAFKISQNRDQKQRMQRKPSAQASRKNRLVSPTLTGSRHPIHPNISSKLNSQPRYSLAPSTIAKQARKRP